ncbi:fatty-acid amide hydrolase 2-A-like isoform X2 [Lineus longissimus]|uniref:fatty-acid amide hydrolase 2-A-like isoform X2 n=1 Tax=Lineus longissimus TaxID=88925 RepID=UPI00315C62DB
MTVDEIPEINVMGKLEVLIERFVGIGVFILGFFVKPLVMLALSLFYKGRKGKVPPISNDILLENATTLAAKIRKRKLKSVDVVQAYIDRIKKVNPLVNAVVGDRFHDALQQAAEVDTILDSGNIPERYSEERAPILGVPFTSKDAFAIKGFPNCSGVHARRNFHATKDAPVVTNLKDAGGIPLCVTNVSELCMWMESSNYAYGQTKNPYDTTRTVGGSSGGEGCLIAAGGSLFGIGSDIGGSIRMPAFFNGVFGHKPTSGLVSLEGSYPPAEGMETFYEVCGPICRYSIDLALTFKVMAGKNVKKLNLDKQVDVKKLKYFYMEDDNGCFLSSYVTDEVKDSMQKVVKYIENVLGAQVTKVKVEKMKYSLHIWSRLMGSTGGTTFCELLGNGTPINPFYELLLWFLRLSNHTFPAVGLGIMEKLTEDESEVVAMQKLCDELKREFHDMLGDDGIFLYPPHPYPAPHHNLPLFMPFNWGYTAIFNVLGLPVTQCPLGLGEEGVPLGIQVVGDSHQDHLTLAFARELESAFGGWVQPC